MFENNPDRSIVEILGKLNTDGESRNDGTKAIINQTLKVRNIGVDGYPVSNLVEVDAQSGIVQGMKLIEDFIYEEYKKKDIVMDYEDSVPIGLPRNGVQEVIDEIRNGKRDGVFCQNKEHVVDFYVRTGTNPDNKPKGIRDELDIMFTTHRVNVIGEASMLLMKFSILQKVVAICTGLVPGRIYGRLGVAYASDVVVSTANDWTKRYRDFYYKINEPSFRCGFTQILINNELMNKWRSQISEIYPNLSDFQENGEDFQIVTNNDLINND